MSDGVTRDTAVLEQYDAVVTSALDELDLSYERTEPGAFLVKLAGEHKLATMTWLLVGDHSLRVEAFVMRCPAENHGGTYRFLLERNARAYGVHWSVDGNGDVFLTGHTPLSAINAEEVDRLLGCVLSYSDGNFDAMLQLGFADAIRQEQAYRARIAAEEAAHRADTPDA